MNSNLMIMGWSNDNGPNGMINGWSGFLNDAVKSRSVQSTCRLSRLALLKSTSGELKSWTDMDRQGTTKVLQIRNLKLTIGYNWQGFSGFHCSPFKLSIFSKSLSNMKLQRNNLRKLLNSGFEFVEGKLHMVLPYKSCGTGCRNSAWN